MGVSSFYINECKSHAPWKLLEDHSGASKAWGPLGVALTLTHVGYVTAWCCGCWATGRRRVEKEPPSLLWVYLWDLHWFYCLVITQSILDIISTNLIALLQASHFENTSSITWPSLTDWSMPCESLKQYLSSPLATSTNTVFLYICNSCSIQRGIEGLGDEDWCAFSRNQSIENA